MIDRFTSLGHRRPDGELVLYSDHAAHVARLEGLLTEALSVLEAICPNHCISLRSDIRKALARPSTESEKTLEEQIWDISFEKAGYKRFETVGGSVTYEPPPASQESEKLKCKQCGNYMTSDLEARQHACEPPPAKSEKCKHCGDDAHYLDACQPPSAKTEKELYDHGKSLDLNMFAINAAIEIINERNPGLIPLKSNLMKIQRYLESQPPAKSEFDEKRTAHIADMTVPLFRAMAEDPKLKESLIRFGVEMARWQFDQLQRKKPGVR